MSEHPVSSLIPHTHTLEVRGKGEARVSYLVSLIMPPSHGLVEVLVRLSGASCEGARTKGKVQEANWSSYGSL